MEIGSLQAVLDKRVKTPTVLHLTQRSVLDEIVGRNKQI